MSLRRKQISILVNNLLLENKVKKAPVPVEDIARNLGATIVYEPSDDDLSGFLLNDKSQDKIIIGVNFNHPETRKRFTISHEIGHLLLHNEETFHIDKSSEGFNRKILKGKFERNKESTTGNNRIEREANLFAAELLMPAHFVENDVSKLGNIDFLHDTKLINLAGQYGVSIQALTYRLSNLNYLQL